MTRVTPSRRGARKREKASRMRVERAATSAAMRAGMAAILVRTGAMALGTAGATDVVERRPDEHPQRSAYGDYRR